MPALIAPTRLALLALLAFSALAMAAPGPASAGKWELQEYLGGEGIHTALLGISCPSTTFCVAVGEPDQVVSSTDPTGGASRLGGRPARRRSGNRLPRALGALPAGIRRPASSGACPVPRRSSASPSPRRATSTPRPTPPAGPDAWHVVDIDDNGRDTHLMAISCPSRLALRGGLGRTRIRPGRSSPRPTRPARRPPGQSPSSTNRSTCAGSPAGRRPLRRDRPAGPAAASTNPTGGASAWRRSATPAGPGDLQGVSCIGGRVLRHRERRRQPAELDQSRRPLSSWQEDERRQSRCRSPASAACRPGSASRSTTTATCSAPTTRPRAAGPGRCYNLLPYVQPPTKSTLPLNGLFGVSCVSISFCAMAAAEGRVYTNTDPFGEATGAAAKKPRKSRRLKRPRTIIADVKGGVRVRNRRAKTKILFRFHANARARRFLCKRDGGPFRRCRSPLRYRVGLGKHAFRVRAIGMTGLRGPITTERFEVELAHRFQPPPPPIPGT